MKIEYIYFEKKFPLIFKNYFIKYFSILSILSVITLLRLLLIPADPKNALIWGFSFYRLAFLFIFLFLSVACFIIAIYTKINSEKIKQKFHNVKIDQTLKIVLGVFIFSILFLLTPPYQFYQFRDFSIRLQPGFFWLSAASGLLLIPLGLIRYGWHGKTFIQSIRSYKTSLIALVFILILFISIYAFICLSQIGVKPDIMLWNENGIPLLLSQVLVSIVASLFLGRILHKCYLFACEKNINLLKLIFKKKNQTILVFLLIWVLVAIFWLTTPASKSYFAPGPYPPNNVAYPFSDASLYDVSAETALIGQGYANHTWTDKPLVSFFSYLIHLISENDFRQFINIQVIVFSIIPPLLYLLGRKFFNQYVGLIIAFLAAFIERNSYIGSLWLSTSHSKLVLSEIPLMLLLILFTLFMIKAYISTSDGRARKYFIIATGVLALSTLVRHNTWFLLPILFLTVFVKYFRQFKQFLIVTLLLVLTFSVTILPWMFRSAELGNAFYFSFFWTGGAQAQERYPSSSQTSMPQQEPSINNQSVTQVNFPSETPFDNSQIITTKTKVSQKDAQINPIEFVTGHFFHNIITTIAILPYSFQFHDLNYTISQSKILFTESMDSSGININAILLLWINLFILAIGLVASFKRGGFGSLIPGLLFVSYLLSLAIARTSGGRYIVPVEWVILVYYAIGLVQLLKWVHYLLTNYFSPMSVEVRSNVINENVSGKEIIIKNKKFHFLAYVLLFFLIGLSIPFVEKVTPVKYPSLTKAEILNKLIGLGGQERFGYSIQEINQFALLENSIIVYGRGLYPRYYEAGEGETKTFLTVKNYSRLTFIVIHPQKGLPQYLFDGLSGVNLPMVSPMLNFPNEADVIVLGCETGEDYIDAALVVVIGSDGTLYPYKRDPSTKLICPLEQPSGSGNPINKLN